MEKLNEEYVYNATFNHILGDKYKTEQIVTDAVYNPEWEKTEDKNIALTYQYAKQAANDIIKDLEEIEKEEKANFNMVEELQVIEEKDSTLKQKTQKKALKVMIGTLLVTLGIGGTAIFVTKDKKIDSKQSTTNLDEEDKNNDILLEDKNNNIDVIYQQELEEGRSK